jgi:homoserine kinase
MQHVTVRVPASTSNLGPGFDSLGIALRIYNRITIVRDASRSQEHSQIVAEAANQFFMQARRRRFSFCYSIQEQIPRSRGLGSSATVRLGVLLALNRLSGERLNRLMIFKLCSELEGHPDNAAPATFGGFNVTRNDGFPAVTSRRLRPPSPRLRRAGKPLLRAPTVQHFPVSDRLHFVLFIPDVEVQTTRARKILPLKMPHAAAVKSCANACTLTAALVSQDYHKLRGAFGDYLHQPFRAKLVPFLPRVIAAAEQAGALGAFLSGSGSTIAAVTLRAPNKIAAAMERASRTPGRTIVTRADNQGAQFQI